MSNKGLPWSSALGLLMGWFVVAGPVGDATGGQGKEPSVAARSQVTSERWAGEPSGIITLSQALEAALRNNPDLEAVSAEIKAQEARAVQAGLLPNPELGIEVENFGGSGDVGGFDATEITLQLSQLLELGEKRAKRKQIASLGRELAVWNYASNRADVIADVKKAFVGVLSAQGRVSLSEELVMVAEQVSRTVSERVKAGKVSPIEQAGASVGLASSRVNLAQARLGLEAARKTLSLTWGGETPRFDLAEGPLDAVQNLPGLDRLRSLLDENPDIIRLEKEIEERRAAVILEDAKRIPDLTVSAGVRRLNESDDNAFVMGVSVPLPLFDRNQGGVLEARHGVDKAYRALEAEKLRVMGALAERYAVLSGAFEEAETLRTQIIPQAQAAFDGAQEGYRLGKFGYLFLLDAERTLFESKIQYLEALTTYHRATADVERLTGKTAGTSEGDRP